MKNYLDLVPVSAKVHKKQNKMSVFCIILAVLLVTTIFGMADMFVRSQIMKTQAETGNWHMGIQNIDAQTADIIATRPDIAAFSSYAVLNYNGEEGYTMNGTDTVICGTEEELLSKIFPNMLTDGKFPVTEKEALVTENAKGMPGLSIGEEISLSAPDGKEYIFEISGFVENASSLMSNGSYGIFVTNEAFYNICPDTDPAKNAAAFYIQFADTKNIRDKISDLRTAFSLSDEQVFENTKLLGLMGQSVNSFMMQVYVAAAVLFVLVLFAGIMMIAGSLNSNVAQRTEFFGLMRCIGATPKQVMRYVRKEALNWCRFAIPTGVFTGIGIIWILCFILRFLSPEYFGAMPAFSVSLPSILAGVIVGLLTVLLAARSPAKKAAKVSPLAAVSGNASEAQPVRKAAGTRQFKVDTALGIHHAKASRKNFILMAGSFALSIILFLSFSVTIEFMNHTLRPLHPWTADISIVSGDNTCSVNSDYMNDLRENPKIDKVYGRKFLYSVPAVAGNAEQKIDLISYEQYQFEWAKKYMLNGSLNSVQNEINTGLVVYEPQNTIQVGDTVSLNIDGQYKEIKIVGMLSDSPFFNAADVGTVICSEDTFRQITGQTDYTIIDMQLTKQATDADVDEIHRTYGAGYSFIDKRMDNSSTLSVYYCVWLFLYGFLVLIALITVFNIINSIAMSVAARTKQYGAFRAIGLSNRQLSKMIAAEAFTYAAIGSVAGLCFGLICNKFLFTILVSRQWGDPWAIPWSKIGIIILIVLVSVAVAIHRPTKRIHNMSIVETINTQ